MRFRSPWLRLCLVLCVLSGALLWYAGSGSRGDSEDEAREAPHLVVDRGGLADDTINQSVIATTEREPAEGGLDQALRGQVRSDSGDPIAGARVTWIALQKEDTEPNPSWPNPGWGVPERLAIEVWTDGRGEFVFKSRPGPDLSLGSVLTALHPGHLAGGVDLGTDEKRWPAMVEIVLAPSEPIAVSVVDARGKSQAGATIHHVCKVRELTPWHPTAAGIHERFFSQRVLSDASGRAELASFPGEQALWAERDELASRPWQGLQPTQVVLTLGESFTLGGTVTYPDRNEWAPEYEGERRILVSGLVENLWRPLVTLRDVQEGEWGPVRVPMDGVARYKARFEGVPVMPVEENFDRPKSSSYRRIDFVIERQAELYLLVKDESGQPLTNAKAIAWWGPTAYPTVDGLYVEGASRPDGFLYLGTFPPGIINYRVNAPGYATVDSDERVPSEYTVEILLKKGGSISGRCLQTGKPVSDFEVIYWKDGSIQIHQRASFLGRENGNFELDNLTPGGWFLHASMASHPGGRPLLAPVAADSEAHVVIEIPAAIRGGGRIVDAESREALTNAQVQVYSSGGMERSFPWGAPIPVGPDGSFDLDAFVLGTNYLTAAAEGYAVGEAKVIASSAEFLDWGDIGLFRPQALLVSLLGIEGLDEISPSELWAATVQGHLLPEKHFNLDGTLQYDGVPPGDHRLVVTYPDGSWARLNLRLDPGKAWDFDLKVSGDRRLDLRVVDARGEPLSFTPMVLIMGQEETGTFVSRMKTASEDGRVAFEGIRSKQVQVTVFGSDTSVLVSRDLSFGENPTLEAEIRAGEAPMRVRLVDEDGAALPGGWVLIRSSSGIEVHGKDDTDADGWASLFGIPEGPVLADINHGIAGRRQGIPLDASVREHELVLEAKGSLELRLVDGDEPLASVAARIQTSGGVTLSEALQTDAAGLVRFEPVGEGTYRIGLRRTDCWPTFVEKRLGADDRAHLDVQMRRLADLELTVFDRAGLPVSGMEIGLRSIEFGAEVDAWLREETVRAPNGLTTDSRGVLRVEALPRGDYAWSASVEGELLTGTFELVAARVNQVPIRLVD